MNQFDDCDWSWFLSFFFLSLVETILSAEYLMLYIASLHFTWTTNVIRTMLSIVEQQMFDFDIVCKSINCSISMVYLIFGMSPQYLKCNRNGKLEQICKSTLDVNQMSISFIHFRFDCLFIVCYIQSHCLKWLKRVYFPINFRVAIIQAYLLATRTSFAFWENVNFN